LNEILVSLDEILTQQQCFSLKDLALNGRDLIEAGVPQGTQIGVILNKLMDIVIDDEAVNDKEVLLEIARTMI
jgi:tRNA nucleotidyltransferase (CCA-adding enzyme)